MEYIVETVDDLRAVAVALLENLGERKIIAFDGAMGAGKTTFVQMILKAMGVEEVQGSPTYSLVNEYESPMYGKIFHFDLYRLNSEEEAYDIGIEEMIYADHVCFIEWPTHIAHLLPEDTIWIKIRLNDSLDRVITWDEQEEKSCGIY